MKLPYKPAILLLLLAITALPAPAMADKEDEIDYLEARRLMEKGVILPLQTILEKVQGRVVEVELEHERDRYLYEIEVLNDNGIVIELEFDATTGELIKTEIED